MNDALKITLIAAGCVLVFLAVIYLFAIGTKRNKEMKKFSSVKFAHRGLHSDKAPENSLPAFSLAVAAGFGIELDVRVSKDKKLVVFHDDTLKRVVGIDGRVNEYTAEELSAMKLLGSEERIPLFDEVLSLVDGKVPLLIEIKENATETDASILTAKRLANYSGDFIIESFNPLSLMRVKKLLPSAPRGILSHRYFAFKEYRKPTYFLLQLMLLNFLCRPSFVAYDLRHRSSLSLRLTRRLFGAVTFAWTVRSSEEEALAKKVGFNSIIFEGYMPEK